MKKQTKKFTPKKNVIKVVTVTKDDAWKRLKNRKSFTTASMMTMLGLKKTSASAVLAHLSRSGLITKNGEGSDGTSKWSVLN